MTYSAFLTAFILNYSESIAVGIWIVNYAFIMSILVKRRYAVAAILLIFAVFITNQVNLLLKQEIDQHELIFRLNRSRSRCGRNRLHRSRIPERP